LANLSQNQFNYNPKSIQTSPKSNTKLSHGNFNTILEFVGTSFGVFRRPKLVWDGRRTLYSVEVEWCRSRTNFGQRKTPKLVPTNSKIVLKLPWDNFVFDLGEVWIDFGL
jgi:hypothetical protein